MALGTGLHLSESPVGPAKSCDYLKFMWGLKEAPGLKEPLQGLAQSRCSANESLLGLVDPAPQPMALAVGSDGVGLRETGRSDAGAPWAPP